MPDGVRQVGYFLLLMALMAILSVMDAVARRRRAQRRRMEEFDSEEPDEEIRREMVIEDVATEPAPWEDEKDWAYLQRSAAEVTEPETLAEPKTLEVTSYEALRREAQPSLVEARPLRRAPREGLPSGAAAVLAALRADAHGLRKAVLYSEILGTPLGSRPGPGGWEGRH